MPFLKSQDWPKWDTALPRLQVPAGAVFTGGGFMFQLLCQPESGFIAQWWAVIPKMQQLDLHAVPTTPVPEGLQSSSNTQLSSELISAIVLDYFLSWKNLLKLCQDYRLPPATSNAVISLTDRSVLPEALRADSSSDIATLSCIFVSFWQGGRGWGLGWWWGLASPDTYSFGRGFWLLSAHLPHRSLEPASCGMTDSGTQLLRLTNW